MVRQGNPLKELTKKMKKPNSIHLITTCLVVLFFSCISHNKLPDPLEAGWQGQSVCEVLQDTKELRVLKCTFPPNVGHEKHYHAPHFGYTINGSTFKITDQNGTREVNVPSNYSFSNDTIVEHEVLNIGDSTAVFLIVEYK